MWLVINLRDWWTHSIHRNDLADLNIHSWGPCRFKSDLADCRIEMRLVINLLDGLIPTTKTTLPIWIFIGLNPGLNLADQLADCRFEYFFAKILPIWIFTWKELREKTFLKEVSHPNRSWVVIGTWKNSLPSLLFHPCPFVCCLSQWCCLSNVWVGGSWAGVSTRLLKVLRYQNLPLALTSTGSLCSADPIHLGDSYPRG